MSKKFLAALAAAMMLVTAGCGSSDSSSETAASSAASDSSASSAADKQVSEAASENGSSAAESKEDGGSDTSVSSLLMTVNNSDGKMKIDRPESKSTPMGDKDTWTIFVYLCGTDLESDGKGFASGDLLQMIEAEPSDNVKFVIQTGGTKDWNNELFSAEEAERWVIQNQDGQKVGSVPLQNMGSEDNLADFLKWGVSEYPAEKMGVILWDHGGGSVAGACVDQLNEGDTLTLTEIDSALSKVYGEMTDKFEFFGFDCCLMGTVETANILASYARYFYGSQETEPGSGWDYKSIGTFLAKNPGADGAELGKTLADSFYDECASIGREAGCTFTIVDLSKFDEFTKAFNDYSKTLFEASDSSFAGVVRGIMKADNFGGNNKSEGYTNMVDVGGIIAQCAGYADGSAVLEALKNCITYNKNGSDHSQATGLSVFYPLHLHNADEIRTFSKIAMNPYYLSLVDKVAKGDSETDYSNAALFDADGNWNNHASNEGDDYYNYADAASSEKSDLITFDIEPRLTESGAFGFKLSKEALENTAQIAAFIYMYLDNGVVAELGETYDVNMDLATGTVSDDFDGYWFSLPEGQKLATYPVSYEENYMVYTSPILLNGERTNLRFVRTGDSIIVEGAWDGIDENGMASREIKEIKPGDKVVPLYCLIDTDSDAAEFKEGEESVWTEESQVIYSFMPEAIYYYGFNITDVYGCLYTSKVVVFSIDEEGKISFTDPDELKNAESKEETAEAEE